MKNALFTAFVSFICLLPATATLASPPTNCDLNAVKKEMGENYPEQYMDLAFAGEAPYDKVFLIEQQAWWKKMRRGEPQPVILMGRKEDWAQVDWVMMGATPVSPAPWLQTPKLLKNTYNAKELDDILTKLFGAKQRAHELFKIRFIALMDEGKSRKAIVEYLKQDTLGEISPSNLSKHTMQPHTGCKIERYVEGHYIRQTFTHIDVNLDSGSKARCLITGMLVHGGLANANAIYNKAFLEKTPEGNFRAKFPIIYGLLYSNPIHQSPILPGATMCEAAYKIAAYKYLEKDPFSHD
ncbi:MAG: hypothetical protein MK052_03930 [Alphaproteobacteria bacterium]|nr:hypothetical protein [Alphaproteobacteria bacterium]